MTTVARTNLPDSEYASGAITPLIRAAAHIGYILGGLASATHETWDEQKDQINADTRAELAEAINHMTVSRLVNDNPFISQTGRDILTGVVADMSNAQNEDFAELRDIIETVQNIGHNLAYAAEFIDRDAIGLSSPSAGRNT